MILSPTMGANKKDPSLETRKRFPGGIIKDGWVIGWVRKKGSYSFSAPTHGETIKSISGCGAEASNNEKPP